MFWSSRPEVRPAEPSDMKWLKLARVESGDELSEDFEETVLSVLDGYQEILILEDANDRFSGKFGPVGMVAAVTNGYLYQPHAEWFPWATPRNKFRSMVAFLQKFQYRQIGVMRVHALEDSAPFFRRLKKYVPLYFAAKIPGGDELGRGDDYLFYMKCRGSHEPNLQCAQ